MKKIALVLVAAMVLVFTGCEKKETISMPFDVADVNNKWPLRGNGRGNHFIG